MAGAVSFQPRRAGFQPGDTRRNRRALRCSAASQCKRASRLPDGSLLWPAQRAATSWMEPDGSCCLKGWRQRDDLSRAPTTGCAARGGRWIQGSRPPRTAPRPRSLGQMHADRFNVGQFGQHAVAIRQAPAGRHPHPKLRPNRLLRETDCRHSPRTQSGHVGWRRKARDGKKINVALAFNMSGGGAWVPAAFLRVGEGCSQPVG